MTCLLTQGHTDRFRAVIAEQLGVAIDEGKAAHVADVLRCRVTATRSDVESYLSLLERHASTGEVSALAVELTVAETYFFRSPEQFQAFTQTVLPDRLAVRTTARTLRILSAGCASGDEAYSLAIAVREANLDPSWNVSILGVDVNRAVLNKAARARFSTWSLRETPPYVRQRWFTADSEGFALERELLSMVRFEEHNLVQPGSLLWQPGAYDVIFCRNVLMYFTHDHAAAVVTRLAQSLSPGGFLFLGHAETLRGLSNDFDLRHTQGAFYYQRRERLEEAHLRERTSSHATDGASAIGAGDTWVAAVRRASEAVAAAAGVARRRTAAGSTAVGTIASWDQADALALLREERFTEALDAMARVPVESRQDPDMLLLEAALLTHRGRLAEAENACRRLLEVEKLSAGAHYLLALCRDGAGDFDGAVNHDRVAAYLDPGFAMPHFHLGLLARRGGDPLMARRELEDALLLLDGEEGSRILLFGGGFSRDALAHICRAEIARCTVRS